MRSSVVLLSIVLVSVSIVLVSASIILVSASIIHDSSLSATHARISWRESLLEVHVRAIAVSNIVPTPRQ
jgi:hypothetical protein